MGFFAKIWTRENFPLYGRYIDFPVLFRTSSALAKPICIFSIRLVPCSPGMLYF